VFVGDSTPASFEADRAYLRSLCSVLTQLSGPPIGIVLQANKRDFPDAVPIEKMRSMLDGLGMKVGVVESVATEGSGIRETFVFAVRLALDRVRELMRTGELRSGRPSIDTAEQLLDEIKRREDGALELAVGSVLSHTRLSEIRSAPTLASQVLEEVVREDSVSEPLKRVGASDKRQPDPPNERVASGMVWPPVDGRVILQEIGSSTIRLEPSSSGDWWGVVNNRWRLLTFANSIFESAEQGRSALIQLARTYAANARGDATERCVVLANDGQGRYRLWQIQRMERT
jgi:hypothetical protein